ncbi:hypothetical protein HMPREF9455_02406 [Dysgonomonas gadei ATCC BAA-286]|uniref:Uncharacterized protein n=1 Tax=Dysgonomonas gadei ATCC BAA-286 TaxID=742766 RepID=F5IZ89_9BACT|nr:hypothetical protein HMPREF9455_02406 [Dysgonomonas gadei ATCC BAA-286]
MYNSNIKYLIDPKVDLLIFTPYGIAPITPNIKSICNLRLY